MLSRADLGSPPALGYSNSRIERAAELRLDNAAVAALADDRQAGTYVIGGDLVILKTRDRFHDPLFTRSEAQALCPNNERVFLGTLDGAGRFGAGAALSTAEALKANDDYVVTDLRSIAVQGLVDADHLPPLAEAKSLLHWHARHRFCANCGAATNIVQCGWRRDCPSCNTEHFPRTDPVAIMLAVKGDRCVLGRSARFAPTMWSCLAGFVEPGESIDDAVRRETREEAGIACGRVVYMASQPWPFPSSLMLGCYAEAISESIVVDKAELEDARWFRRDEIAAMLVGRHPNGLTAPPPMAIAHHIMRGFAERGADVLG